MTPELQMKVAVWRQKALEGTLTETEMIEAIKYIREGRVSNAFTAETTKRKKAVKEIPSAADLLSELGDM